MKWLKELICEFNEEQKESHIYTKYRVEYGNYTLSLSYLGNTIEELYEAIDSDLRTDNEEWLWLRRALKEGYFGEFVEVEYKTSEYVIDNCMHFIWTVK